MTFRSVNAEARTALHLRKSFDQIYRFSFSSNAQAVTILRAMKLTTLRLFMLVAAACVFSHATELKTRNVFLIMTDGLRWQEVFTGAEELLISTQPGGVKNTNELRTKFWRNTPEARRAALMPFL